MRCACGQTELLVIRSILNRDAICTWCSEKELRLMMAAMYEMQDRFERCEKTPN